MTQLNSTMTDFNDLARAFTLNEEKENDDWDDDGDEESDKEEDEDEDE